MRLHPFVGQRWNTNMFTTSNSKVSEAFSIMRFIAQSQVCKLINSTWYENLGNRMFQAEIIREFILTLKITWHLQQLITSLMDFFNFVLVYSNLDDLTSASKNSWHLFILQIEVAAKTIPFSFKHSVLPTGSYVSQY